MTIPVQHDDDDFYINTTLADAQATIAALQDIIKQMGGQAAVLAKDAMSAKEQVAALQARVQELCKFRVADHEQLAEVQKYWRESQDEAHELRKQLTQRTAELEAAKAALTATSQPVPPYKEWCRQPEKCAGLASCPRNPTCAD